MIYIKSKNSNDLFIDVSIKLLNDGEIISPRGLKTLELQHVWLELTNPGNSIVSLKSRNANKNYLKNELKWYLSGSLDAKDITKHSKFWDKLKDSNGTINSNYGFLALKEKFNGISQYEWCINSINNDVNTRQAVINYNQPKHKYDTNRDFVCTLAQHFMVRNGKLDSTVFMRSNDLIFGLTYDLPWFCLIQKRMAKNLNLKLGTYRHYAASLHVYEKHFSMLKNISKEKYARKTIHQQVQDS